MRNVRIKVPFPLIRMREQIQLSFLDLNRDNMALPIGINPSVIQPIHTVKQSKHLKRVLF